MRAPEGPVAAVFFDGQTSSRHEVTVVVDWRSPAALILDGAAPGLPLRWPLERLRALSDQADTAVLVVTLLAETEDEAPRDPARLVVGDRALRDWILASRPNLFRRDLRKGTGFRLATRTLGALAAFLLILFVLLPRMADTLAGLIPAEREAQLGRATVRQIELVFGGRDGIGRCENAEAQAIWDTMAERFVDRTIYEAPLTVIVLDDPMVNAFAAPGGHIVFFRGMIEAAESPDELAAVMAHEVGHVVARDPTRLALRSVGSVGLLGLLLGDFAGGGLIVVLADQLLDSSYSREAEEKADRYAFDRMVAEGIDPAALGDLFARLRDRFGDVEGLASHIMTHPSFSDRIAEAARQSDRVPDPVPALTDAEFTVIKASCRDD